MDNPIAAKPLLLALIFSGQRNALFLLFLVSVGVLIFYMFSLSKDFQGTKPALRGFMPGWSDHAINRLDLVMVIFFGSFVAAVLFNPSNYVEALTAGIGWVGALNTIGGPKK